MAVTNVSVPQRIISASPLIGHSSSGGGGVGGGLGYSLKGISSASRSLVKMRARGLVFFTSFFLELIVGFRIGSVSLLS